jgi:hypothetical protein
LVAPLVAGWVVGLVEPVGLDVPVGLGEWWEGDGKSGGATLEPSVPPQPASASMSTTGTTT